MKKLLWIVVTVLIAGCVLPGCALMEVKPLPGAPVVTPQDQAMKTVTEAQLLIGAIVDLLDEQRAGGIIDDEEYYSYEPILSDYYGKTTKLRRAIAAGVPDAAKQAELLKGLLFTLHQKIALKARN